VKRTRSIVRERTLNSSYKAGRNTYRYIDIDTYRYIDIDTYRYIDIDTYRYIDIDIDTCWYQPKLNPKPYLN